MLLLLRQPRLPFRNQVHNFTPGLSLSQSTITSTKNGTGSNPAPKVSIKRLYDKEIKDGLDAYLDDVEAEK
jgi:hypothetical protein